MKGAHFLVAGGARAWTTALSWRYRPNSLGWANAFRPPRMAVQVLLFRVPTGRAGASVCRHTPRLPGYPPLRLPLRITHPTAIGSLEGVPNASEYRFFGRVRDDYNAMIRVDFSSRRPTTAMLSTAQRVLTGLGLPHWPHHC